MFDVPDSFFDELVKISAGTVERMAKSRFNPVAAALHTPGRGAVSGGLAAGGFKALSSYAKDREESARDIQRGLTDEQRAKTKKLRRAGAIAGVGLAASSGAAAGALAGKANKWGRSVDPEKSLLAIAKRGGSAWGRESGRAAATSAKKTMTPYFIRKVRVMAKKIGRNISRAGNSDAFAKSLQHAGQFKLGSAQE